MNFLAPRQTTFKCTYKYCGRLLPLVAIEPKTVGNRCFFECPVCSHKSPLVNEGGDGAPDRFFQQDSDEHGRHIADSLQFS